MEVIIGEIGQVQVYHMAAMWTGGCVWINNVQRLRYVRLVAREKETRHGTSCDFHSSAVNKQVVGCVKSCHALIFPNVHF